MSARYEIWLCNPDGTRIADLMGETLLERTLSFTATRIANDIGTLTIEVPETFDRALLRRDLIIQVWRAGDAASLSLFRPYFLRRWTFQTRRGETSLELHGRCPNDLLRRRVVTSAPGTLVSTKGGLYGGIPADDIMKEIVSEALIDATGGYGWPVPVYGTRVWPLFSVEANAGAGPVLTNPVDVSYEYVLQTRERGALFQVINEALRSAVNLYFDVVPLVITGDQMTYIFRVRLDQPGQDITGEGVLFSQDRGNLTDCELSYDYTAEENYIYGVKEAGPYDTKVNQRYTAADHDASIWNRCEGTVDRDTKSTGNYLRSKRGKVNFTASITDTQGMRFGVDWHWGDKVRVRYQNFQIDAVIKAVTLQVDRNGKEKIGARLEYQGNA